MRADQELRPGQGDGDRDGADVEAVQVQVAGRAAASTTTTPIPGGLAYRVLKRALDIGLGALMLILALPLLLPACLVIWLETPGAPLFLQWRSGLQGRPFRIVKLRTMVNGAERTGPALTQAADPRITRVGSLLRRWSIDELPQLFNVVAGQMSLVGPRPELVTIVAGYTPRQRQVLQVRPGLTGWAQINGRDELPIPAKIDLELDYVAARTALLDLKILLRTVWVVLSGQGATR
jgi:lipopolysaccharide/colanic/teichoic acid biosynthesis glycosyltransferase